MNTLMCRAYLLMKQMLEDENGQDLVEYALVVALIAFGVVGGMHALANGLNKAFNTVSTTLSTSV
ncbi:MAG: Flp family type IVb pilin [Terracidiphilus sp.]|jgi:pilus assembly protein Flp/PilA